MLCCGVRKDEEKICCDKKKINENIIVMELGEEKKIRVVCSCSSL